MRGGGLFSMGALLLFFLSLFMGPFIAVIVGLAALVLAIYWSVTTSRQRAAVR